MERLRFCVHTIAYNCAVVSVLCFVFLFLANAIMWTWPVLLTEHFDTTEEGLRNFLPPALLIAAGATVVLLALAIKAEPREDVIMVKPGSNAKAMDSSEMLRNLKDPP